MGSPRRERPWNGAGPPCLGVADWLIQASGECGRPPLQDREPYLDLIEPGRACRREMKLHIGMGLEPMLVLFVGVEVVEDDVKLAVRKSRGDTIHEVEKLDAATAF